MTAAKPHDENCKSSKSEQIDREQMKEKMHTLTPPTEDEIEDILQNRLEEPGMKLKANESVRAGYKAAVDILADDVRSYEGVPTGGTVQSRAIAVLVVDYLNGVCTADVLLKAPTKVPLEIRQKNESLQL